MKVSKKYFFKYEKGSTALPSVFLSWTFVGALWQAKEQSKPLRKILSTIADSNNKMQPIMVAVNERDHLGRI